MNTKFFLFATALFTALFSCTNSYEIESVADRSNAIHEDVSDVETSTDADKARMSAQRSLRSYETKQCYFTVSACLVIDDGAITEKDSSLVVTVEKIVLEVTTDDDKEKILTFEPLPNVSVAEPEHYGQWGDLPCGLDCKSRILHDEAFYFEYLNYYDVDITITYNVRVKDNKLTKGYVILQESMTTKYVSNIASAETLTYNIPIKLSSVKFNTKVDDYETNI